MVVTMEKSDRHASRREGPFSFCIGQIAGYDDRLSSDKWEIG